MRRVQQLRAGEFTRPIRINELARKLPVDEAIEATQMALVELAIAQALVMIHGKERAALMYVKRGGHVRYDSEGEPVLLWNSRMMST